MNSYLISYVSGTSAEIQADYYQADGEDLVFVAGQEEILRVSAAEVLSVTQAHDSAAP